MKNLFPLLLLLLVSPCFAGTFETVPQIDRTQPISTWPTSVTVIAPALPYTIDIGVGSTTETISWQMYLPGPGPIGVTGLVTAARGTAGYRCDRDRTTKKITCDGIYLGIMGERPDTSDVQRVLSHLLRTYPMTLRRSNQGVEPNQCYLIAVVRTGTTRAQQYGHTYDTCTPPPAVPVSCTISGPSTLSHPNQQSTNVSGSVRDKWRVDCSDKTLVTVSTTRDVILKNQSGVISTGLYVERTGVTTLDIFVERTADVYIVSELETPYASPGLYTGSGIIYVTWY